ncbi:MAG: hypothetical protein KDA93_22925, partial [Planctomycetaceae bacterium]|nr:hypothetical protein [Planctomycetaceae bacterium]
MAAAGIEFDAAAGNVVIQGTDQSDVAEVRFQGSDSIRVTVQNGQGFYQDRSFSSSSVSNIVFEGHSGDDHLRNETNVRVIAHGGDGDDSLTGGSGNDQLYGDAGEDTIDGGAGDDVIVGGMHTDELWGGDGNDLMYGDTESTAESVLAYESGGADQMHGGAGDDVMYGGTSSDRMYGDEGDDQIYGGHYSDHLIGGLGNDVLYGQWGGDLMQGDLEDESGETVPDGVSGKDTLYGGLGNDYMLGGADDDLLYGEDGNDNLYGGRGNDELHGGNGDDYLRGHQGTDLVVGDAGSDKLFGDDGNDQLFGSVRSLFDGSFGSSDYEDGDLIGQDGWEGNQMLLRSDDPHMTGRVIDGFQRLDDTRMVSAYHDFDVANSDAVRVLSFETYASSGADDGYRSHNSGVGINLRASWWAVGSGPQRGWMFDARGVSGNSEAIEIIEGGFDAVVGFQVVVDAEAMKVYGRYDFGEGPQETSRFAITQAGLNEMYLVNVVQDWRPGSGGIKVGNVSMSTFAVTTDIESINPNRQSRFDQDEAHGGDGDDSLTGGSGNDQLYGDAGEDTIDGGAGDDVIYGGTSSDRMYGGEGEDLLLGDEGSDTLSGGVGQDVLVGGQSTDYLNGDEGDDLLIGGFAASRDQNTLSRIQSRWVASRSITSVTEIEIDDGAPDVVLDSFGQNVNVDAIHDPDVVSFDYHP